ncbi:hypothetical protein JHK82_025150 [Glycine max]|nr:hypothetical protein JHK82_025150 [Glycine max]
MVGNGIQGGFNSTVGIMDSVANNNSFGLINETSQNANKNVAPLEQGNFGLAQGTLAFAKLITNNGTRAENIPGNRQLPQQLHDNVAENDNGTSIGEGNVSHMEDDGLSDLFKMLDEIHDSCCLNQTEENPNTHEFLKSDFSSSNHVVQYLEQSNRATDVIVNPTEGTSNMPNQTSISSDNNSNQFPGLDGYGSPLYAGTGCFH